MCNTNRFKLRYSGKPMLKLTNQTSMDEIKAFCGEQAKFYTGVTLVNGTVIEIDDEITKDCDGRCEVMKHESNL